MDRPSAEAPTPESRPSPAAAEPRGVAPGRNAPCHCGSGRKYKKCCSPKDEAPRPLDLPARTQAEPTATVPVSADPADGFGDPTLAALIAKCLRDDWTHAKVTALSTAAIEAQLARYGVKTSRLDFRAKARELSSAYDVSHGWHKLEHLDCFGTEADFLDLAACELWNRYLPERPSDERLADWIQEGYALLTPASSCWAGAVAACDTWGRAWHHLRLRLPSGIRTLDDACEVVPVELFSWLPDFVHELDALALENPAFVRAGKALCIQVLTTFPDESDPGLLRRVRSTLAGLHFQLGDIEAARQELSRIVEHAPDDPWTYLVCANVWGNAGLLESLGNAIELLERGLMRGGPESDAPVLRRRLHEFQVEQEALATAGGG